MDVVFGNVHAKHKGQIGRNPFRQIAGFPHREINERIFALSHAGNESALDIQIMEIFQGFGVETVGFLVVVVDFFVAHVFGDM